MSMAAAFLRVLLCVSLVFSGSVAAATSAMMSLQQGPPTSLQSDTADHPACHGRPMAGVAKVDPRPSAQPGSLAGTTGQSAPDCCDAGTCSSACLHQAQVPLLSNVFDAADGDVAAAVAHVTTSHAEPALPSLIRPPIG